MKIKVIVISIILIALFLENCTAKSKLNNHCKALNDSAVQILTDVNQGKKKIMMLDSAIKLLDLAIQCDSNYFIALSNKAHILSFMNKYYETIKVINRLLVLTNNDPGIIQYKGVIYEKMNQLDSARSQYDFAEKTYIKTLQKYPDSLPILGNYLFLIVIKDGKDSALRKYNELDAKFSNNPNWLFYHEMIVNFNRKEYFNYTGGKTK